jgi:hypothetical protein
MASDRYDDPEDGQDGAESRDPHDDLVDDGKWRGERPDRGSADRPGDGPVPGENATTEEGEAHDPAELSGAEAAED